ncbi:MAG: LysR family transcriptional regulator [Sulfitobacter sp.]|nr:LysR family transcriptional regulator [Sulfitobacter sp.]
MRYVLAVIEAGSVSAAARALGVNHATVLRKIATFEEQYGAALFDKGANGYRILPGKEKLVEALSEVENGVLAVQRLMEGANPLLRGVVRIASTDTICQYLLPSVLGKLQTASPELEIELLSNNSHLDFARMEADLFVRPALSLPDDVIGEVATHLVFRAYGIMDCPDKWLSLKGPLRKSAAAKWLGEKSSEELSTTGSDSFLVLAQMALSGLGIAVLPSFVGEEVTGLAQLPDRMPDISVPIWVGSHRDLRDIPRIRAVRKSVIAHLHLQGDHWGVEMPG